MKKFIAVLLMGLSLLGVVSSTAFAENCGCGKCKCDTCDCGSK